MIVIYSFANQANGLNLESRSQREGQTNEAHESNTYKKEDEPVLDITSDDLPF